MSESNSKLIKAINHYQQNLERYSTNNEESKMLHCIERLQGLPIQVCHLEETGIGRTVNSLRKINGTVGEAARALVNKWKNMVAQDEGEEEDTSEKHVSSHNSDNSKEYNDCIRKDKQVKEDRQHTKDKNNDRHHSKDRHDNKHSSKEKSNDRHSSNDRSEDKTHLKEKNEDRHREKKHEPSGSSRKHHEKDRYRNSEESSRKRKHESSSHLNNTENGGSNKDKDKYSHKSKRKYDEENSYNKHQSSSDNCNDDSQSDTEVEAKKTNSKKRYVDKDKHESKKQTHSSRYSDDQSDQEVEVKRKSSDKSRERDSKSRSHSDKHKESSSRKYEKRRDEREMDSQSDQEVEMKKSHMESESRKHKDYEKLNETETKKRHSEKYKDDSQSDGDEPKKKIDSDKHREHSSKKHKSSKHSKSEKHKKYEDENNEKKKSDKSTNSSSSSKNANEASSSSETNKSSKKKKKVYLDDGIDCGSGASFAEALGMLLPEKTSSKTIKKVATSSPEKNHSKPSKSFEPKLLLTSIDKLEPLDINITSLLPTISTNYKPLPMMNCESKSKVYNDDEALTKLMYSKNQRTKVYSGNKTYIKMPTLFELCTRILQDNIDALEYTGGVPYAILKPVLEKATPEQLFTLEHHNPYIIDDSDELWNFHCLKEFRNKKREELESAREMYMRCLDEREAKLKALTANIKLSQDKSVPVRQTKLAYVDSVAKPPRNIAKKQIKNGIEKRPCVTPSSRLSALATAGADVVVPNHRRETSSGGSSNSSNSMNKMKKAPLMAKTLQLMKGRFGRR